MEYLRQLDENEEGALSAEYVGVLVIVGGIISAILLTDIGSTLTSQIGATLSEMFS
jgi:Flp pilus assembly pilin Flp